MPTIYYNTSNWNSGKGLPTACDYCRQHNFLMMTVRLNLFDATHLCCNCGRVIYYSILKKQYITVRHKQG